MFRFVGEQMNRKMILVVEDEEIERNLVVEVLDTLGYDAVSAENGRKALDIIAEQDIDLILTDIHMPEINGLELLKRVRDNGKDIPVILMTGFDPDEAREFSEKYEAAALLIKPFRLMELKSILEDQFK